MSNDELIGRALRACVDIYLSLHVSEIKDKSEHLKEAWSVGKEVYAQILTIRRGN